MDRITHFVWTDIDPEEEDAFNTWYSDEHVPDRVLKIPGFLRGRRFRANTGGPRYVAYYEMLDRDVFWTEEYVQLRGNPDPKSRYFVQRFKNALRSTAVIDSQADNGEGPYLGIVGLTRSSENKEHQPSPFTEVDLKQAIVNYGVSRVRLNRTDWELVDGNFKRMSTLSRGSLRPPDRVPGWMLTVEGDDEKNVADCLEELTRRFGPSTTIYAQAVLELISEVSAPPR